jgi:hypothetical protein
MQAIKTYSKGAPFYNALIAHLPQATPDLARNHLGFVDLPLLTT